MVTDAGAALARWADLHGHYWKGRRVLPVFAKKKSPKRPKRPRKSRFSTQFYPGGSPQNDLDGLEKVHFLTVKLDEFCDSDDCIMFLRLFCSGYRWSNLKKTKSDIFLMNDFFCKHRYYYCCKHVCLVLRVTSRDIHVCCVCG